MKFILVAVIFETEVWEILRECCILGHSLIIFFLVLSIFSSCNQKQGKGKVFKFFLLSSSLALLVEILPKTSFN